jgi:glyoxylase I family protein
MRAVFTSCMAMALAVTPSAFAQTADAGAQRQTALGIGGLFVRAEDPAALSAWYEKHLGINPVPTSYEETPWVQEAGPTIFSPMPDTASMIPDGKSWMLNLRVADIEAFAAQLKAEGVAVELDLSTYPNGRFAMLADPEGNPIQLWEPKLP